MQVRRYLGAFLTILSLHVMCFAPAMAAEAESQAVSQTAEVSLPAAATPEAPVHFKAGVKYDPVKHEWLDRYSNKTVDLGLPGLTGKYGANEVLADASTSSSSTTTTTAGGFPWKKFIIITVIIAGVATAIAVPIACGVHHHHNNASTQNNQAAAYYFFHNQTLPIPTVPHGPDVFIPTGVKPPPKLLPLLFH